MLSERSTSTMKSEPGRSISLSTPAPVLFGAGFVSPVAACAVTVVAASVAAAPFRKVRRASLLMKPPLADRGRGDGRAGSAEQLQRVHAEGELVDLLRDKLVHLHVLEQVDAVHHQHDL